jgi:hypothetical protein
LDLFPYGLWNNSFFCLTMHCLVSPIPFFFFFFFLFFNEKFA